MCAAGGAEIQQFAEANPVIARRASRLCDKCLSHQTSNIKLRQAPWRPRPRKHQQPSIARHRASDGRSFTRLSSSRFSVSRTSGRPCHFAFIWQGGGDPDSHPPDLSFFLGTRTFRSAFHSGARNSPMAQRASSTPSRASSRRTSSYVYLSVRPSTPLLASRLLLFCLTFFFIIKQTEI